MITRENYEEYIMMHVDGELQPAEEAALNDFMDNNPGLKNELLTYELTRISPDETVAFERKEALLQPVPVKRTISLTMWKRYGIAAGVAALFFVSLFKLAIPNKTTRAVKTDNRITQQPGIKNATTNAAVTHPLAAATVNSDSVSPAHGIHSAGKAVAAKNSVVRNGEKDIAAHESITPTLPVEAVSVNKVAVADIKELPYGRPETVAVTETEVPAYALATSEAEEKKTFWDKLPIDELKKTELKNISTGISDTYTEIKTVKKDLNETTLTVKVEKRRLILSF